MKLSKREGLIIQTANLEAWHKVLKPEIFELLITKANRENDRLKRGQTGYDVWRGQAIDDWVKQIAYSQDVSGRYTD